MTDLITTKPDLLTAMDEAAVALLRRVGLGGSTESATEVSVREQCQIFQATAEWVQWREKAKAVPPAAPVEARVARLRGKFHDAPVSRANRKRAGNGHADQAESAVDPA